MYITSIRPRRKSLSAVCTDEREEPYIIDTNVLSEQGIKAGTEISDEEILRLSRLSANRRAKDKALRLIEFRDHSESELHLKLLREYDGEAAEYAVDKMRELGLIDDARFARNYMTVLIETKKYSKARAARELWAKGIDRQITDMLLSEFETDPSEQIKRIIEKRFTPLPEDEKGVRRMMNYLIRLGYSYGEITSVLKDFQE